MGPGGVKPGYPTAAAICVDPLSVAWSGEPSALWMSFHSPLPEKGVSILDQSAVRTKRPAAPRDSQTRNASLPMTAAFMAPASRRASCVLLLGLFTAGLSMRDPAAAADLTSPVGRWRTIDDATGQPRAVVRIFARDGRLYGIAERSLAQHPARTRCDECTDDRRGKPIIGMELMRDMAQDGEQWDGGTILDPESGRIYRCRMTLRDHGMRLAVRGYLGLSLLGRTQVWERID